MSGELTGRVEPLAEEPAKKRYDNCNVAGSFISPAGIYLIASARINEFALKRPAPAGLCRTQSTQLSVRASDDAANQPARTPGAGVCRAGVHRPRRMP